MISIYIHAEMKCLPKENGIPLSNSILVAFGFDTVMGAYCGQWSVISDIPISLTLWVQVRHPYCDLVGVEAGVLLYFQNIQSIQKVYLILVTVTKVTRIKIRLAFTKINSSSVRRWQCSFRVLIPVLVLRVASKSAHRGQKILCACYL